MVDDGQLYLNAYASIIENMAISVNDTLMSSMSSPLNMPLVQRRSWLLWAK